MKTQHARFMIASLLLLALAPLATAQPKRQEEVTRLTVRPAAEPRPALRWRLLPNPADEKSDNAATMYLLALKSLPRFDRSAPAKDADSPAVDVIDKLLETPPAAFPRDEARKALARYLGPVPAGGVYSQLETAAWRDRCQWDLAWEKGITMLLPHLNDMRWTATLLSVQARLQMAEGDLPGAVHTLQILFALGRDLNEDAVLIQGLVGAGVNALGAKQVEQIMQQPGAPNLYWALANLPRPYFDMPAMIDRERRWVFNSFPVLRTLQERGQIGNDQWVEMLRQIGPATRIAGSNGFNYDVPDRIALPYGILAYPQAKQYLLDRGMPREQVERMNVATALTRWMLDSFNEAYDEMVKWCYLPVALRGEAPRASERNFGALRDGMTLNPLRILIPSLSRAGIALAQVDRRLAMLQAIEAIRDYAAAHDGQPPATLADVTALPVPPDPFTGRPFEYQAAGNTFILQSSPPQPNTSIMRFEVTIAK